MTVIALTNGAGPHSGDPCPRANCPGRLVAYCSRPIESAGVRIKFLHCNTCHGRPERNQQVVPLKFFPRRND